MVSLNKYDDIFLIDKDFLRLLDQEKEREIFAKIVALDFNENPLEKIEGRVTQGSVSVDGTSAVRRTCSLSLVAHELNIHEFYWGLNTKFKLYIGVRNTIKERPDYKEQYHLYPDICWFKMGTYVISTFSTSQSTSSYTISIQGKDKMTLLNGEVGGIITPLSWDFGKIDTVNADGSIMTTDYLLKDIILEAVHEHAKEPYWNIIINDLDDCGLELLEYRGDIPMYLIYGVNTGVVETMQFNLPRDLIGDIPESQICFDYRLTELHSEFPDPTEFIDPEDVGKPANQQRRYTLMKAEYGDVIGYRTTDLTYAGDLISNVGETVTSMLDKIKEMLGEFEYFYDLDGRFVFQRKKTYIQSTFTNLETEDVSYTKVSLTKETYKGYTFYLLDEDNNQFYLDQSNDFDANKQYYSKKVEIFVQNAAETSSCVYSFDNAVLVTSFSNSPNFGDLKNDYSLWGVRKGVTGIELPIHLRYAIDTKPWMYIGYNNNIYITAEGYGRYEKLMDEYKEAMKKRQEEEAIAAGKIVFKKIMVPDCLKKADGSSDWWDITNWAEYYFLLTGALPDRIIGDYGTEGFKGSIKFPNGTTQSFSNQLVIDLERDTHNPFYGNGPTVNSYGRKVGYNFIDHNGNAREYANSTWSPFQHGFNGCGHTYNQFIYLDETNNCQSFIYKPELPTSELTDDIVAMIDTIVIEDLGLDTDRTILSDWRELIYQMSVDYNKHHHDEDFLVKVDKHNTLPDDTHLYLGGYTGYEQYYIDINGFWRDLYNPYYKYTYTVVAPNESKYNAHKDKYYIYQSCTNMTYEEAVTAAAAWEPLCGGTFYFCNYKNQMQPLDSVPDKDLYERHPENYCFVRRCDALSPANKDYLKALKYDKNEIYFAQSSDDYDKNTHWVHTIKDNPELLNFWFDFLDTEGELDQYKVCNIGDRTKANNDTNINSIYYRDVPTVIFVDPDTNIQAEKEKKGTGYTYIRLPDYLENLFSISGQGKSAMDVLNDWLYSYAYCAESITINALPIYYLEPNNRILVRDDNSGINGEYIITRLTFPLTHNGTMSISATKAVENLY